VCYLCQLASSSHHFIALQCLHLQGPLVLQNVRSTEPTAQCHIPWILSPQKLSSENIKSCTPKGPALYVAALTSVDGPDQSSVSSVAGRASGHLWTGSTCQNTLIRYAVSAGLPTACLCGQSDTMCHNHNYHMVTRNLYHSETGDITRLTHLYSVYDLPHIQSSVWCAYGSMEHMHVYSSIQGHSIVVSWQVQSWCGVLLCQWISVQVCFSKVDRWFCCTAY